ncbi:MAG: hypothetical protein FWG51_03050, partial [Firmicutes bacterium]|nr:hypothetical protein [Bacillota bacterium]
AKENGQCFFCKFHVYTRFPSSIKYVPYLFILRGQFLLCHLIIAILAALFPPFLSCDCFSSNCAARSPVVINVKKCKSDNATLSQAPNGTAWELYKLIKTMCAFGMRIQVQLVSA